MAGSEGSYIDEIDFAEEDPSGFASASYHSNHDNNGYSVAGGQRFSPEPEPDSFLTTPTRGSHPPDLELYESRDHKDKESRGSYDSRSHGSGKVARGDEEDEDVGPLTPRRRIVGNGFERPIHRQSLQEFESLENLFQDQAKGSRADSEDMLLQGDGDGGGGRDEEKRRRKGSNLVDRDSDSHAGLDCSINGDGSPNGMSGLEENGGGFGDGEDDMMKYMLATPRSTQDTPTGSEHQLSRVIENDDLSERNLSENASRAESFSQDFCSLSQEQLPEHVSHLELEDSTDLFAPGSRGEASKHRDSLSTIIQAAAANVEMFGSEDSPEGKKDLSGGEVEHFKPIATSQRRPSRPETAAQLKYRTIHEQMAASDQNSEQYSGVKSRSGSVTPAQSRSSRATTPQSVLSPHSRGSRRSGGSHGNQSDRSLIESEGMDTPRSSTPGHDWTLTRQGVEMSPSPVKQTVQDETVPRLRLNNTSGRSDQSVSDVSDISLLNRAAKSRLVSDEFVDQLQKEYDDLLQKYAQAENTIDSLRLGARVNLEYCGRQGGPSGQEVMSSARHAHTINLSQPHRGIVSHTGKGTQPDPKGSRAMYLQSGARGSVDGSTSSRGESKLPPDSSEGKLLALVFRVEGHKEQMESFETLLREAHLNPSEQERGLEGLRTGQDRLEGDYMQAKEEHSVRGRLASGGGQQGAFDPDSAVQGQIFKLGMQLENIQEEVQANLRNQPAESPRPPDSLRLATPSGQEPGVPMQPAAANGNAEEYALLISRYDALKKLPPHPERDKEIQQLVKNLQAMPDFAVQGPETATDQQLHKEEEEEEDIDSVVDGGVDDHDGDVDGYSNQSSPFRESVSPDVFRPMGRGQQDLPEWHPPVASSVSSLASGGEDRSHSHHSRRGVVPGKGEAVPGAHSGHRSSQHRGASGDGRRAQRGKAGAHVQHLLDPEQDSGFVGSESSRQSQQPSRPEARQKRMAQRLSPHSEVPKVVPARDPKPQQPRRISKTPLQRKELAPSSQQREPDIVAAESDGSAFTAGSVRTRKSTRPHTKPQQLQRNDVQPMPSSLHTSPPANWKEHQGDYMQSSPHPASLADDSLPLGSQFLSRTPNGRHGRGSAPIRRPSSQLGEPSRGRWEKGREQEADQRSDVTGSSVRSKTLRALQAEVAQLRGKMADAHRNPPTPSRGEKRVSEGRSSSRPEDDGASTRSGRSEAFLQLQEEIADLKEQLAERDQTAGGVPASYTTSTPYSGLVPRRDTIRSALKDRYIPRHGAAFGASPIRNTPKRYGAELGRSSLSALLTPTQLGSRNAGVSDGAQYGSSGAPQMPRYQSGYHSPGVGYQTKTAPCPTCGGCGTHTQRDHHHHHHHTTPPPVSQEYPTYNSALPDSYRVPPTPLGHPPYQSHAYTPTAAPQGVPPVAQSYEATPPGHPPFQSYAYTPTPAPAAVPQGVPVVAQNYQSSPFVHGQSYVYQANSPMKPGELGAVPLASQQAPGGTVHTPGGAWQGTFVTPAAPTASPAPHQTLENQPRPATSDIHPDARPVYLIPMRHRGRYYVRDGPSSAGDEEELWLSRTPRSASRARSKHRKVSEAPVPMELQLSLDEAQHVAEKLKSTTQYMVSAIRMDVQLAESFNR